jgi:DNA-binding winged helix-turn-helix (wHTH) protein
MSEAHSPAGYRFGVFEVDTARGELRRQGLRIKLHAQPFALLILLLRRPGEVVGREELCRELWPDGTFVDYEHGVNSAINRLREALGDRAASPRYVETVARRGYRFVAPVERVASPEPWQQPEVPAESSVLGRVLAAPSELPRASGQTPQALFVLLQVMYLIFYAVALANLGEIEDLIARLAISPQIFYLVVATAVILIPVRIFLICAILFRAPRLREKFLRIWPALLAADALWSLSPFLLLNHMNYGLALGCMALLVYAPFAQRSLMLMADCSSTAASPDSP